ncbi:MAG: hydrolase TatD [Candidatus Marinimicrobia bacterium]|nr:hydrolase TatD [Candidatus Neomarinimicrobiota bacterium]|tara:strand:- start:22616 stop:23380 length:765 start_codon:yes stop_codon:yes gene_type:complete
MIDTHCHINDKRYKKDLNEVILKAIDSGVQKMICVGVDLKTSEKSLKIADTFNEVYASVGYHPHESKEAKKGYLYELESMAKNPKVVAIGETGLDYHYNISNKLVQKKIFNEQIELSKDLKIPIIIHNRSSDADLISIIESTNLSNGVVHCFSGDWDFAKKLLSHNIKLSFTGMITFIKDPILEVLEKINLEDFFIETDSPYLAPAPYRGKRNEPSMIKLIAEKIADVKKLPTKKIVNHTTDNALKFFKKLTDS